MTEQAEVLRADYPGQWPLLLLPLCAPKPHRHGAKACTCPGKRPTQSNWGKQAHARLANGADPDAHLEAMARHVAAGRNVGLGVPVGAVVLDADTPAAVDWLEKRVGKAPRQDTAKGAHFWLRLPVNVELTNTVDVTIAEGITVDVRSAGTQLVVAPSMHASGTAYRWVRPLPPTRAKLPAVPKAILEKLRHSKASTTTPKAKEGADPGALIPEGMRNDVLYRNGCSMRGRGAAQEEITVALRAANTGRCRPPLTEDELAKIIESIVSHAPGSAASTRPRTDAGNAERLIDRHGEDLRYVHAGKRWYIWNGQRWVRDDTGEIERRALDTVRSIYAEAAEAEDADDRDKLSKWARFSESGPKIDQMIKAARKLVPTRPGDFDLDPMLFNIANGTIDLKTGKLRNIPDPKVRAFLQRAVGYSLTGSTEEEVLFLLYGTGQNGKSKFRETIRAMMGDYAKTASSELLMARKFAGIPNDIAALQGARFVPSSETEEGRWLAETKVKDLTGGDTLTARFLFGEYFDFKLQAKFWICGNHKPVIRGTDEAIWRRIRLIPFTVFIPPEKRDPKLGEELLKELPGILNLAIEGCLAWQRERLNAPAAVLAATEEYRETEDQLGAFLDVPRPPLLS